MRIKSSRTWYEVFVFDFESHNDEESIANLETSIWLGCLTNTEQTYFYYTIPELLNIWKKLTYDPVKRRKTNLLLYAHNLAFEWSFIAPYLFDFGFEFIPKNDKDKSFSIITNSSCSSVWSIRINFGGNHGIIEIRDTAKMFNTSVAKLARNYGLPYAKGEIDYKLNRLHGHVVTQDEKDYCYRDCQIVMEVLKTFKNDKAFWSSVSASSYACTDLINGTYKQRMQYIEKEYDEKEKYTKVITPYRQFREEYPKLKKDESEYTRNALNGGITWVNPKYQFTLLENVFHIDIHSAHPTQAYTLPLPYGKGEFGEGEPKCHFNEIAICRVRISFDSVNLPCLIPLLAHEFVENYEITLFTPEIELCKRCYGNFKVEYLDYYKYKIKKPKFWKWYGTKYNLKNEGRATNNKHQEALNKLFLNAGGYGKFVEKGHNELRVPVINEGILQTETIDKGTDKQGGKFTHIPFGACIPMFTRYQLVNQALKLQAQGCEIIYFDTDSIFFLTNDIERNKKIIPIGTNIGQWSFESIATRAVFEVPKRYVLDIEGKVDRKAGGFNNFDITEEIDGEIVKRPMTFKEVLNHDKIKVLMRVKARGGTLLVDKEKVLEKPERFKHLTWEFIDEKERHDSLHTGEDTQSEQTD